MQYLAVIFNLILVYKLAEGSYESYITGGSFARYSQYPHAVYLQYTCNFNFICGGSVLNQDLVLTAAHCFHHCLGTPNETVRVCYGHQDIEKMNKTKMRSFVLHEYYSENSLSNDIALILTKTRIPLSDVVKRVILLRSPPWKMVAYVAGWGADEHNKPQATLKHVVATIQKLDVCEEILGWMPKGAFCAGPITGLGAAAQGDSGSSLVISQFIQIGVVSFKTDEYALVAYSNVSYYLDWIKETSKRLYCRNHRPRHNILRGPQKTINK